MSRKRLSSSSSPLLHLSSGSKFTEARLLYDDNSIQRRPNAALLLEEIKQEVDSYEAEGFEGEFRMASSSKRRASIDAHSSPRLNLGPEATHQHAGPPLTSIKQEDEVSVDAGEEATFTMFASLLDSALQGCRNHKLAKFFHCTSRRHRTMNYDGNMLLVHQTF